MPRLANSLPKYRHHKASGQAVVTLSGTDVYLGMHGTRVSRAEYDRVVGEWLACGRQFPDAQAADDLTVVEVLARYWPFAKQHYQKDGRPTGELENMRCAARLLKAVYGHTLVREFGPLALKALQLRMIDDDLSRGVINGRIGRIKRIFRWAVSEQLCPPGVLHGLQSVTGLQRGRTEARETEPVRPVDDRVVEALLPYLPLLVADMVRFQRLVGCRPGEVCKLRPCDVDRSDHVWAYRPASHKTDHHGHERVIFIGPKAQNILRTYLLREPDNYCFSPAQSERRRKAILRASRKTRVQPSQHDRRKKRPRLQPGDSYDKDSYARAIRRACDKADVPRWSPNQLRHAAGSAIRRDFGLEAAQCVLGHSRADVTQVYAQRDWALAAKTMAAVG